MRNRTPKAAAPNARAANISATVTPARTRCPVSASVPLRRREPGVGASRQTAMPSRAGRTRAAPRQYPQRALSARGCPHAQGECDHERVVQRAEHHPERPGGTPHADSSLGFGRLGYTPRNGSPRSWHRRAAKPRCRRRAEAFVPARASYSLRSRRNRERSMVLDIA